MRHQTWALQIARLAGPALRRLLWIGRDHLGSEHFTAASTDLRRATDDLVAERMKYLAAVERRIRGDDVASIRLEIQVLAEVRREWDGS